ncbi:MAG: DinB family protein [Candidatus Eiseniibacteriota bacterium]
MKQLRTGAEIIAHLRARSAEVAEYFRSIPEAEFFAGTEQHWGPAHHLGHLALSHSAGARGFRHAGRMPAHPTGRSRSLEELRGAYAAMLASPPAIIVGQNPLTARFEPGMAREQVIARYRAACDGLCEAASNWSEADLDARAMQHPTLGLMTAREMLQFFGDHDRHHLNGVMRRRAQG